VREEQQKRAEASSSSRESDGFFALFDDRHRRRTNEKKVRAFRSHNPTLFLSLFSRKKSTRVRAFSSSSLFV